MQWLMIFNMQWKLWREVHHHSHLNTLISQLGISKMLWLNHVNVPNVDACCHVLLMNIARVSLMTLSRYRINHIHSLFQFLFRSVWVSLVLGWDWIYIMFSSLQNFWNFNPLWHQPVENFNFYCMNQIERFCGFSGICMSYMYWLLHELLMIGSIWFKMLLFQTKHWTLYIMLLPL